WESMVARLIVGAYIPLYWNQPLPWPSPEETQKKAAGPEPAAILMIKRTFLPVKRRRHHESVRFCVCRSGARYAGVEVEVALVTILICILRVQRDARSEQIAGAKPDTHLVPLRHADKHR